MRPNNLLKSMKLIGFISGKVSKNLLLGALILIASTLTAQQYNQSAMQLRLEDNGMFQVYVNGQLMGGSSRAYVLQNLTPGNQYLRIEKTVIYPGGMRMTFDVFEGYIYLPSSTMSSVVFRSWNQYYIEHQEVYIPFPSIGLPVNAVQPMDDQSFASLISTIDSRSFDSDRLKTAQTAMQFNYFKAEQVKEIIDLMSFEDSRLELAKLAYDRTIDKGNYFMIYDSFWFSSSIDDLSEHITMR